MSDPRKPRYKITVHQTSPVDAMASGVPLPAPGERWTLAFVTPLVADRIACTWVFNGFADEEPTE